VTMLAIVGFSSIILSFSFGYLISVRIKNPWLLGAKGFYHVLVC
jgi:hypothetical protein